jgi:hypothetical protein
MQEPEVADFDKQRLRMVAEQIAARGVRDRRVLGPLENVPREAFVPVEARDMAYYDGPLEIGAGQTISQPYIVAFMIEALTLKGGERSSGLVRVRAIRLPSWPKLPVLAPAKLRARFSPDRTARTDPATACESEPRADRRTGAAATGTGDRRYLPSGN